MSANEDVVLQFSRALVSGHFAAAHALLDPPLSRGVVTERKRIRQLEWGRL